MRGLEWRVAGQRWVWRKWGSNWGGNGRAIESREGYITKNAQKVHRESFYTYLNLSRIQVSIIYTHKLKKVT